MDVRNKSIALLAITLPIIFGSIYAYANKSGDTNINSTTAQMSSNSNIQATDSSSTDSSSTDSSSTDSSTTDSSSTDS
jgi:cytoskeletal protein RodZ